MAAGAIVSLGRRDPEAPGWVWCRDPASGREGWVPESLLEAHGPGSAHAREDYDAIELTVRSGSEVRVRSTRDGWCWCVDADGAEGWVPRDKLDGT